MGVALQLLLALAAGGHASAWNGAAGPPFVVAWTFSADGRVELDVTPRWVAADAIAVAVEGLAPMTTLTRLPPEPGQPLRWSVPLGVAPRRLRATVTWRDPFRRAGATAVAIWPTPTPPAAPQFAPLHPLAMHGLRLDQAVSLP